MVWVPYHLGLGLNDRFCMTPRLSGPILSTRLDGCLPLSEAIEVLRSNIASKIRLKQSKPILERLEIEIEPTDLLRWLAAQASDQRSFFRNREGNLASAGVGCALDFSSWEDSTLRELLKPISVQPQQAGDPSEPLFYYASFFDPDAVGKHAPEWAGFDRMHLVLPMIEIRRTNETILAVHVMGDGSAALAALEQCECPLEHLALPRGLRLAADGDPVRWADGIDAALGAIASGSIEKVVLARTRRYSAIESINPCGILAALMEEEPSAFHFLVEQVPGRAFLGASPERLFRRIGNFIQSEAVAGTCGRGPDAASDDRLAGRLLASDKNRREHEIVIRRIESVLSPMVDSLICDESPSVMRLRHVQHLMTTARGQLLPQIDDAQIISELHPTPAVCGWPVAQSREFIREHEKMSRGLYSGVVGMTSPSHSEFSVAIRTALINDTEMTAYSGAGIVRGSDADAEWLETERKLSAFDAIVVRASNELQSLVQVARMGSHHVDAHTQSHHRQVTGS